MGDRFTHGNHTIVARRTIVNHAGMIKDTVGKRTWCMADVAIRASCKGYMMIGKFNATGSTAVMTGIAPVTHNIGARMVNELRGKGIRMVAITAITVGIRMVSHASFANGDGTVVATFTRLAVCVDNGVIKHVNHESPNTVANPAVDRRIRVTTIGRFADARARGIMALVTPMAHYIGTPVIRKASLKGIRGMTVAAITSGNGMIGHPLFAGGNNTVVAGRAASGNTGMVKSAISL